MSDESLEETLIDDSQSKKQRSYIEASNIPGGVYIVEAVDAIMYEIKSSIHREVADIRQLIISGFMRLQDEAQKTHDRITEIENKLKRMGEILNREDI